MSETLKVRNQIKLAASASAVTGYYDGFTVEFTRYYKVTGKKTVQKSKIAHYDGPNRVATLTGLWMPDVIPGPETAEKKDTYRIIPSYADSRVSTNPAIQALDYITSTRYGRGLNAHDDLYLPSWLETARYCDAKSDVTVETTSASGVVIGDVYRYPAAGDIQFQGKVTAVTGNYVRFTDVIGKLTHKWNTWKSLPIDSIIYEPPYVYRATTSGLHTTRPIHSSGTVGGLQYLGSPFTISKVSGAGPATLSLPINGNPVRGISSTGATISGYSLYDADGVNYWRYLGWDEHDQRYVCQHQTNIQLDTSQTVFDNMNNLLEHFGGMMRYDAGKYVLEIEDAEGGITPYDDARYITEDDILSKIKITDEGIRSAYNSLTVAFADPGNKFEARNISFFNSDYLKSDRNVPKKGSLSIPGITNYYNARLLSERYLTKSRFGMTVSFNMTPKGVLLTAGRVVQLPYSRYGWTDKKFRINSITHNPDTSVDIVATEYDDSFYLIKSVVYRAGVGQGPTSGNTPVSPPTALVATNTSLGNELHSGIELTWQNATGLDPSNLRTEIYASGSPNFYINFTSTDIGKQLITTSPAHGLSVGDTIVPQATVNGLTANTPYYVVEVPSPTTLKLSTTKGGPVGTLANSGAFSLKVSTARLISEVSYPESRYFDAYTATATGARIVRYYWVRYRVN